MKGLVFIVGILLFSGFALADISITGQESVYSLGDRVYIDLDGIRGAENGNLDIGLRCRNRTEINLVRIPARAFAMGEDQTYSVPYKVLSRGDLGVNDIDEIVGTCQVTASLGSEVSASSSFEVRDDVDLSISLDGNEYNPGDAVKVIIDADKPNGADLNGFFVSVNGTVVSGEVVDGEGASNFVVSETAEGGVYYLEVKAYDVDSSGNILNEGKARVSYVVNSVPTSLVLSLGNTQVVPGNNFSLGVEVFDQAGVAMDGSVFLKVVSSDGKEIESIVESGDFFDMDFPLNSSVGTWKVLASFDGLAQEREFEILPVQKVSFSFEDDVLIVKNIGNVIYNKTIDVKIGEEFRTLNLNIGVGEVRKFSLEAPVGRYDVKVGDGESEFVGNVLLTGNAINVKNFSDFSFVGDYSFVWIFLIVIFGGIGGVLIMKNRKTRRIGKRSKEKGVKGWWNKIFAKFFSGADRRAEIRRISERTRDVRKRVENSVPRPVRSQMDSSLGWTRKSPRAFGLDEEGYSGEDSSMMDFTRKSSSGAESVLTLKGERQRSSVVSLSIKNFDELGDAGRESLKEVVESSRGKGLVDYREEYIFIVFSPLITRTYGNEKLAVSCALKMLGDLKGYNKKFRDKVEFGIGVHSGDLVSSKHGHRLKYTGVGNTISMAKGLSDLDRDKVVISDEVRRKMIRDLKVDLVREIGGKRAYVVSEVRDRSGDVARLQDLLRRSDL